MKKYIFIIFVGFFWSCDLEKFPESDLSDAVYWQTEKDFVQALNTLYTKIPGWERFDDDNRSDIQIGSVTNSISDGSYIPTADFGPWNSSYETIRIANNVINKLNDATVASEEILEGEARFFRALSYFQLLKAYGGVPLVLNVLDITSEELYKPRDTREAVVNQILGDLDFAVLHLPSKAELTNIGRLTNGAALALKARVALYEGTRAKYHEYDGAQELLQKAKKAALSIIESGQYSLYTNEDNGYDNYNNLFLYAGEGSNETILAHEYGINDDNLISSFNNRQLEQGVTCATRKLVDAYLCTDGLPIDKSPLFKGWTEYASEWENRDPRLLSVILKRGDDLMGKGVPWTPTIYTTLSGILFKKYAWPEDWSTLNSYIDWMFIRYAEVLLIYAEASFELDGTISDDDLNLSINKLRDRVEMPHLNNAFVSANRLDMLEEIRRERMCELVMEGFRYDDIMRWKIAEEVMPQAVLGARLFAGEYDNVDPNSLNLTADSVIIAQPVNKRFFDPAKHYLWPLPLSQLGLNDNLKQNPKWD